MPRRRIFASVVAALLLAAPPGASGEETAGGAWTTRAPAPVKRTEVAAAAVEGKIYVVGGFEEPTWRSLATLSVSDRVDVYDPDRDRWETKAPLPTSLHHVGAAVAGGKLYVVGGFTRSFLSLWHPVATVYVYDPATDRWTERAPMPTARGALALAVVDGKLYAVGGYAQNGNVAALEVYDPGEDRWSAKAPLPTPRDHLAAAAVAGRLYALGGRLDGNYARNLAATEIYNPVADRWTNGADMPTARSGITAGVIGDVIYVLGGEAPEGTFQTNEAYRPGLDRWETLPPMPTGRHGLGSAVVHDRLYAIAGGPSPGGSFSNVTEVFAPPAPPAAASGNRRSPGRASPRQVGAVMAMLAAFEDAGALPPESSPDANRLIKALIQFQAAFMKSANPAVQSLLREACTRSFADRGPAAVEEFRAQGWSSTTLEALVDYVAAERSWERPETIEGFRAFNLGPDDFALLARTFRAARTNLAARGDNLHTVFAARRKDMPGAGL